MKRVMSLGYLLILLSAAPSVWAATRIFEQDFETNTVGVGTTCVRSTTNPRTGSWSMRCNYMGVGGVEHDLDANNINHNDRVIYMSWWHWHNAACNIDDHGHFWRWYAPNADSSSDHLDVENYTDHMRPIMFLPGSALGWDVDSATIDYCDSTWHHFEALIDTGTLNQSDGSLKIWDNGTLIVNETNRPMERDGVTLYGKWAIISNNFDISGLDDFVDDTELWNACPSTGQLLGGDSPSCTSGPDTAAPTLSAGQPTGTLASGTTSTEIRLNATDVTPPITCKYGASPGSTSTTDYASLPNTMGTSGCPGGASHCATVSGLSDGNTFTYYVRCQDSVSPTPNANTSSLTITFNVSAGGSNPPTVPTNLTVINHDDMTIAVDWDASTDPDADLAAYRIWECHSGVGCTPSGVAGSVSAASTSLNIIELVPGTTYYICVTAFDALDNQSACSSVVSQATTQVGIAAEYPEDQGIDTDGRVVWYEPFHGYADVAAMVARYTDSANTGSMTFQSDIPTNAPASSQSIRFRNPLDQSTVLYKEFPATNYTQLFLRYLVKYVGGHLYDGHSSSWLQGYSTLQGFANPQAGTCNIDGRLSGSLEIVAETWWDTYIYWPAMHVANGGSCFGNELMDNTRTVTRDTWHTVEVMIRMNSGPAGNFNTFDGEFAAWLDGVKVSYTGLNFPQGTWTFQTFTPNGGTPFEGFQWRKTSPANSLNNIWIQHFTQGNVSNSDVFFDQLVVSRAYVGPLVGASGDTLAPSAPQNLRVIAP